MDNKNDLSELLTKLRTVAEQINGIVSSIEKLLAPTPEPAVPAKLAITLEQVRAVLAEKSHDGFTAEVRALLQKHGADKLSLIDPSEYESLMKDAEALSNG